jgi:hypothetical protein
LDLLEKECKNRVEWAMKSFWEKRMLHLAQSGRVKNSLDREMGE